MDRLMNLITQIIKDAGKGVKGYIQAQFILMLMTFVILSIGLTVIKVSNPILISIGISIIDILPIVGSGIIMIPWSIINFILGNKDMGINLAIIYIVLIIIRQIAEPQIMGKRIGVRPIYTFISTILGAMILGPVGVIIGPLIAVVINSIIKIKKELP